MDNKSFQDDLKFKQLNENITDNED